MGIKRVLRAISGIVLLGMLGAYLYLNCLSLKMGAEITVPVETAPVETAAAPVTEDVQPADSDTPSPTPIPTPEPPKVTAAVNIDTSKLPDIDITSWEYMLVNGENPVTDYAPVTDDSVQGVPVDARIVESLKAFIAAARTALGPEQVVYVSSGYRDYETQNYLYKRMLGQYGEEDGQKKEPKPGCSDHQTGLSCDITDGFYEEKTMALDQTELYKWMSEHCQEYGFIVRFASGKQFATGVEYKPWHFRYVGVEAAAYIMANNLSLEEFIALYK